MMKNFDLLINTNGRITAIKQGFSFVGAFFPLFWFIYKQAWLILFGFMLFSMSLNELMVLVVPNYDEIIMQLLSSNQNLSQYEGLNYILLYQISSQALISLVVGYWGNHWLKSYFLKRGFIFKTTIKAKSSRLAINQFIKEQI